MFFSVEENGNTTKLRIMINWQRFNSWIWMEEKQRLAVVWLFSLSKLNNFFSDNGYIIYIHVIIRQNRNKLLLLQFFLIFCWLQVPIVINDDCFNTTWYYEYIFFKISITFSIKDNSFFLKENNPRSHIC